MVGQVTAWLLVALHFLTLGSELLVVVVCWQTRNYHTSLTCLVMLLVTGSIHVDAVWRGVLWQPCGVKVLPVRRLPRCRKICCCCPLLTLCGCLQAVVVPLTLQQVDTGDGSKGKTIVPERNDPKVNIFHCKAVTGLFEGIVCTAVVLYTYLGSRFPEGSIHPITDDPPHWPLKFLGLRTILRVVVCISVASGCLGILHLDNCICLKLEAYIRSGSYPRLKLSRFWLLRTCELTSRVSLHVFFLLLTCQFMPVLRWGPLVLSVLSSVVMMYVYGGNEASRTVRYVCGVMCTFVNIFRFVDSPYKRRAAKGLSRALEWRHVVELIYMPCLAVFLIGQFEPGPHPGIGSGAAQVAKSMKYLFHEHPLTLFIMGSAFPLYFLLLCSMSVQQFLDREKNIFEACEQLDVNEVRRLTLGGIRVDVNRVDTAGKTPLATIILHGEGSDERSCQICRILLESGAKVDMRAPKERIWIRRLFMREARLRWTPLHLAARRGSVPLLRELLAGMPPDADVEDYRDSAGETPLHVAVSYRRAGAARCLAGRFPEWTAVTNRAGKTPRSLAQGTDLLAALSSPALVADSLASRECARASAWTVQDLVVHRVTKGEGLYRAPGLCSYVVGAAGGPAAGAVLRMSPEGESSLQPRSSEGPSPAPAPAPHPAPDFRAEELEPVSKRSREPCPEWLARVEPPDLVGYSYQRIGRQGFCREAVLGKGAYGVVWLGRLRRGGQEESVYATKNVSLSAMKGSMDRVVRREWDMSDRIRMVPHPCVVKVFGMQEFVDADLFVLTMEFLPGGDLQQAIRAAHAAARAAGSSYQSPQETLPWLAQIFLALEHLHLQMQVLLRDLKPDNVVLDSHRRAKLIDLGLGRVGTVSDGAFTLTGQPPGTPGYCAPEVLQQLPYNEKADLYSFGVTAWVLLTGGLPGPPTGFNPSKGIKSCFNDCHLLHKCINAPQSVRAADLPTTDAYTFVMSLTAVNDTERPSHKAVRNHAFFTEHLPLPLPEQTSGKEAVERWLVEMDGRLRAASGHRGADAT